MTRGRRHVLLFCRFCFRFFFFFLAAKKGGKCSTAHILFFACDQGLRQYLSDVTLIFNLRWPWEIPSATQRTTKAPKMLLLFLTSRNTSRGSSNQQKVLGCSFLRNAPPTLLQNTPMWLFTLQRVSMRAVSHAACCPRQTHVLRTKYCRVADFSHVHCIFAFRRGHQGPSRRPAVFPCHLRSAHMSENGETPSRTLFFPPRPVFIYLFF